MSLKEDKALICFCLNVTITALITVYCHDFSHILSRYSINEIYIVILLWWRISVAAFPPTISDLYLYFVFGFYWSAGAQNSFLFVYCRPYS